MHQGPYTIVEVGFLKQCMEGNLCSETTRDMATVLGYKRDAIRVKVIKYDGMQQSECRKFSVDPQITSYEVLYSLLAKAFDVRKEFSICYRVLDDCNQETFLPLLSDYELDAAIQNASDPCLCLRIDFVDTLSSGLDQDVAECVQPESSLSLMSFTQTKVPLKLQGLIKNQVEKTFNIFKGALSYMEDNMAALYLPPRSPLNDTEFRQFLDPVGQIIQSRELRTVIYYGGIEPSLRRVVWKHILNVYPEGMSGKERMEYTRRKSEEYYKLRDIWKDLLKRGQMVGDLAYVTGMVRKDVLRTDRHHVFYAGADDNCNVISLFNILTTYALNHPAVSYCQGMSDLASPLLVTMSNEAHAYICFCALMRRLGRNFLVDGITMTQRFQHLADGLEYYHPKFYEYLKSHQADDLLYCYRWLLLEMKREFAFNDALIMLEVMWSSLPPNPPQGELPLYDVKFEPPCDPAPNSPSPSPRENQYTKVCAIRRQTTSATSSPFKLNATLDESPLAQRRKQDSAKSRTYPCVNETKIISTNGILKSCASGPQSPQQSMVQKFTQLTKDNIHKSLEKINSQGTEYANHVLNRRGSLKMQTAATSTKIVRNLNEFLNFSKKIALSNGENNHVLNKQISLDERNRREYGDEEEGMKRRNSNIHAVRNHNNDNTSTSDTSKIPNDRSPVYKTSSTHENPLVSKTPNTNDKNPSVSNTPNTIDSPSVYKTPNTNANPVPSKTPNTLEREIREAEDHLVKKIESMNSQVKLLVESSPEDDDSSEYFPMTCSITQELRLELENLNRNVLQDPEPQLADDIESGFESTNSSHAQYHLTGDEIFIWENPLDETKDSALPESCSAHSIASNKSSFESDNDMTQSYSSTTSGADSIHSGDSSQQIREVAHVINSRQSRVGLPPPNEFGGGNPFLMFLCISVLCQHSEHIMNHHMDYNEMAIYFDKMVRKHNVHKVLNEARKRYESYLCNYRQLNRQTQSPRV
ncbi:hypothetical protein M8J76_008164 [Diaphorina citri]|nr:hypothetical protein M8J75_011840 [Diaphorina citri]KAI5736889.1 hypothetical protein M8J76_008164 [Diaphorina citri]